MEEIWKPVKGFEGYYEVSNLGRVRSIDRYVNTKGDSKRIRNGRVLKGIIHNEYVLVTLSKDNLKSKKRVHRIVAEAFLPNPDNLPQVNHKDEDKTNNNVTNLEWCDSKYNMNYGTLRERMVQTNIQNGTFNPDHIGLSKLEYQRLYQKENREKINEYNRKYRNKKKVI